MKISIRCQDRRYSFEIPRKKLLLVTKWCYTLLLLVASAYLILHVMFPQSGKEPTDFLSDLRAYSRTEDNIKFAERAELLRATATYLRKRSSTSWGDEQPFTRTQKNEDFS
jgi:hypothetical protein